jgi:hypothetical protein
VLAQLLRKVAAQALGNTLSQIDDLPVRLWSGFLPFPDDLAVRFSEAEEADEEAAAVANEA